MVNPFSSCLFLHFYLQQSSSTNANGSSSSSGGDQATKTDSTQSTGSSSNSQPIQHSSHIITTQSPYQISHHHSNHYHGNRSHYRGSGHPRHEPLLKRTTGIPRNDLIQVPRPIPGALRGQTGASFVPRQTA
jgi:hypothetical protein